jgi:pyruvate formate lyase activating enzyme
VGKTYSAEELLNACLRDRDFYETSGGGITLSGGEPVLHSPFLLEFLPLLREHNLHVVLETAGHYSFKLLGPLLPLLDHVFLDYKLADPRELLRYTGADSGLILDNLRSLLAMAVPLTVRIPLIPGMNTRSHQIDGMCASLNALDVTEVCLLKYNHLWESKIPRLNTRQRALGLTGEDIPYDEIVARYHSRHVKALLQE